MGIISKFFDKVLEIGEPPELKGADYIKNVTEAYFGGTGNPEFSGTQISNWQYQKLLDEHRDYVASNGAKGSISPKYINPEVRHLWEQKQGLKVLADPNVQKALQQLGGIDALANPNVVKALSDPDVWGKLTSPASPQAKAPTAPKR